MFKVLREVAECTTQGKSAVTEMKVGGRVRSPAVKALLAKQLGQGMNDLESQGLMDLKTGRIASKKPKKEKSPEQQALGDAKLLANKWPGVNIFAYPGWLSLRFKKLFADIPSCLTEMADLSVRNSAELAPW